MSLIETHIKNFGVVGRAKLTLVGQGLVLILGTNKDTDSADSNGSGKTTLFKALTWGLFGQTVDGDKGDEVIRKGEKEAEVKTFRKDGDGDEWCIVRTRTKGKPGLMIRDPKGNEVPGDRDQLQAIINDWLGVDFDAFRNTALYGQNDSYRFADPRTKDSTRKDMLHRILRTGLLADCHRWALDRQRELKTVVDDSERVVDLAEAKRDEHNLEGIEANRDSWEADRAEDIEDGKATAREAVDKAKALAGAEDKARGVRKKLDVAKSAFDSAMEAAVELSKSQTAQHAARTERSDLHKAIAELDAEDKVVRKQLDALSGDECPTCSSPLGSGAGKKFKSQLERDAMKLGGNSEPKRLAIEEIDSRLERMEEEAEIIELRANKADKHKGVVDELTGKLETLADSEAEAERFRREAKSAIAEVKNRVAEDNPFDDELAEAENRIEQLEREIDGAEALAETARLNLAHAKFWVTGFSNQGLPSYVLDAVMPFLSDRTNHYLRILADGDITMTFSTQRELKSRKGAVRDEIDIQWTIEDQDGVTPSGGQRKRMEVATDLALMDLVASREGVNLDLIMLDEVLDGLDAAGRDRVFDLLRELVDQRGSVFVISHDASLTEMFERVIHVQKKDGEARLI